MPKKIILVRHGETDYNQQGKIMGWLDIPLNQAGKLQAQLAATSLKTEKIDAIYSSDLKRASQTAQEIADTHGLTPILTNKLRERQLGVLQGKTWDEVNLNHKIIVEKLDDAADLDWKAHQGESYRELWNRVDSILQQIIQQHPEGNVIIITHGGTKAAILKILRLVKLDEYIRFNNSGITVIEKKPDNTYSISSFNDTSHLD